eukprot:TRINITY_DN1669_c0_g1_i1.p1 TRINITY_DN1669_c0_g1~~TRINITY_DN1669_c0_g1_i1.p1  ORF type:complete len:293 (+),score=67.00 TRINITY_DN1669_c0_g1_i1:63-941(+)
MDQRKPGIRISTAALPLVFLLFAVLVFAEEPELKDLRVATPSPTPSQTIDPNLKDIRKWNLDRNAFLERHGENDTELDYQHWGSDFPNDMWQDTPSLAFNKNNVEENQEEDDEEGNWIQDGVYDDADADGIDAGEGLKVQKIMHHEQEEHPDQNQGDVIINDLRKPVNDSDQINMESNNDFGDNDMWKWGSYSGGDPDNADLYQGDNEYYGAVDREELEQDAPEEKFAQTDDPPQENNDHSRGPRMTYKKDDIEGQLDGKNAMDDVLHYYRFRKFEKHQVWIIFCSCLWCYL